MHGDEPTATMALFDLFNFLDADDAFNLERDLLTKECTLYFLPMVNPDGAEVFTRRNAQLLDINRDYFHQTPEGRMLRELQNGSSLILDLIYMIKAFGGRRGKAVILLLYHFFSPAYDDELSVNATRERAMRLIAGIASDIHPFIPGNIGRFSDEEYKSRAFGDNFQKAGTSTVLIEAGGYINDREKQFLRKIYFASILSGLIRIARKSYETEDIASYYAIPENKKRHYSIILRNFSMKVNGQTYTADIGLCRH